MKAVCFQSVGEVKTIEIPDPVLVHDNDAIIKVSLAGLCGSDLHPFFGRESGLDGGTVMGHEMAGTIVDLGSGAAANSDLKIGDRVFAPFSTSCGSCYFCSIGLTSRCEQSQLFGWRSKGAGLHGCQAEYVRIPLASGTLLKIPTALSDDEAILLGDNFSTGYFCAEMADINPDGVYAVIGCGTVGQLCIQSAKALGAATIFAIDPVSHRREQAAKCGAIPLMSGESAIAEIKSATSGRGVDAVMELVGLPAAQQLAFAILRPGGVMSVIGCHCTRHFSFSPVDAYDKNLTYRTGRCPARAYMDSLTPQVVAGKFNLSGSITHRFNIDESRHAYDVFANQRDDCLKAVISF